MKTLLAGLLLVTSLSSFAAEPELGSYISKSYSGINEGLPTGTCGIKIVDKLYDENGQLDAIEVVFRFPGLFKSKTEKELQSFILEKQQHANGETFSFKGAPKGREYETKYNKNLARTASHDNPLVRLYGIGESDFLVEISTAESKSALITSGIGSFKFCPFAFQEEGKRISNEEFDQKFGTLK